MLDRELIYTKLYEEIETFVRPYEYNITEMVRKGRISAERIALEGKEMRLAVEKHTSKLLKELMTPDEIAELCASFILNEVANIKIQKAMESLVEKL